MILAFACLCTPIDIGLQWLTKIYLLKSHQRFVCMKQHLLQCSRSSHRVSWLHKGPGHDVPMFDFKKHHSVTVPKIWSQLSTTECYSGHDTVNERVSLATQSQAWSGCDVSMFDWAPQCYSVNRKINLLVVQYYEAGHYCFGMSSVLASHSTL